TGLGMLDRGRTASCSRGDAAAAENNSPGRVPRTRAPLFSLHDLKVFGGPAERSLHPHGASRPCCSIGSGRSTAVWRTTAVRATEARRDAPRMHGSIARKPEVHSWGSYASPGSRVLATSVAVRDHRTVTMTSRYSDSTYVVPSDARLFSLHSVSRSRRSALRPAKSSEAYARSIGPYQVMNSFTTAAGSNGNSNAISRCLASMERAPGPSRPSTA